MGGNLFWGNHLLCLWIKLRSIDAQVLFRLFHPQTTQSTTAITSIVVALATNLQIKCKSLKKFLLLFAFAKSRISLLFRHCEANHRLAEAIQKNKCASAPRISPDSWCKKSESKGAVVPPADFLLESEKRGSPPKSEKRQLLARRGSEAGGAALLRKENGDKRIKNSKADLSAESRYKIVPKVNFSKVTIQ